MQDFFCLLTLNLVFFKFREIFYVHNLFSSNRHLLFLLLFQFVCHILFSCLIIPTGIYSMLLNSSENEHLCLVFSYDID